MHFFHLNLIRYNFLKLSKSANIMRLHILKEILFDLKVHFHQEVSSTSSQNFKEILETLYLAPTLFYHLPGVYIKT